MNAIQRQLIIGLSMSMIVLLVTLIGTFLVFPLPEWSVLWKKEIMEIPFVLFIVVTSIIVGLLFGAISGLSWRKQLISISGMLHQMETGHKIKVDEKAPLSEIQAIHDRMDNIQRKMSEQTKLSRKLANEIVEDQEQRIQEMISQERNRLARELHDSVSQQLFAASMLMSAINEANPLSNERETKQLKMVEQMIHQSQLEMRALLLHLRPAALKGKSLQEGIEMLLVELSQKVSMSIQWKIEETPMEKGVEDHLFRILQESLSNTLRHAKATKLEVLLIQRDELIILRVVDDGVGFDVEETKAGSYGLQNMYERAIEIGGTMNIVSVKNNGTRLEVKIPILRNEGEAGD
ncbi:sensor histidine kinase [Cytobacillus sp. IB215665]|uniref:sensor histidine kinase n=1 Tax=Cytobacillus sp. IB215665 TaxID=3097357 RepID=UPI002A12EED1|nr:sensor histidine kinase [Cytobacillus sp. IB215665]MDX8367233.1 sensor histidine kinase [Cytobacillus sp. IB215665]